MTIECIKLKPMTIEQREQFRAEWNAMHEGPGLPKVNEPYPLTDGMKIKSVKARKKWWFFGPWVARVVWEKA